MASLVAALDFSDSARAIALARQLKHLGPWLKVGLELFTTAGPDISLCLKDMGFKIFLDLKFYDIPNTVAAACKAARTAGADMLTLHLQGGRRMCEAAVEALEAAGPGRPLAVGVTALTSFASGEMPGIDMEPGGFGRQLAGLAAQWRLDGVVCSGMEAAAIKKDNPGLLLVCPGIRPAGADSQDQRRVMTPAKAVANGADFLVVGRPITSSPDPAAAAERIMAEMREASTGGVGAGNSRYQTE